MHPQVRGPGRGLNCELARLLFKQSSHPTRLVPFRLSCARKQYLSENMAPGRLSLSDELLQEQRADMDQFSSSFSETPVDVRVSSEESDEIPPFHSLHPFPSLPENEGAYAQQASPAVGPRAGRDVVRKWKSDEGRGGGVRGMGSSKHLPSGAPSEPQKFVVFLPCVRPKPKALCLSVATSCIQRVRPRCGGPFAA